VCFFFQAEDGIRDLTVTGVQTCALPIYFGKLDWEPTTDDRFVLTAKVRREDQSGDSPGFIAPSASIDVLNDDTRIDARWERSARSEERRVGKEWRSRGALGQLIERDAWV